MHHEENIFIICNAEVRHIKMSFLKDLLSWYKVGYIRETCSRWLFRISNWYVALPIGFTRLVDSKLARQIFLEEKCEFFRYVLRSGNSHKRFIIITSRHYSLVLA